jgi:hypothetical protein
MNKGEIMKTAILFASAFCLWSGASPAFAQIPNEGLAARIIAGRGANDTLLKQYSWTSRVKFYDNDAVQDLRIDTASFGPDGQLQRTLVNDQRSPLPRGFLRRRVAEQEKEKVEKYLIGLRNLLDQYTLPSAGKILDYVSQAQISAPDSNGLLKLTGASLLMPGDSYTMWIEPATCHVRKIQVTTTYEQDMVELTSTCKTIQSGLTHLQFSEVDVPGKQIKLQVHNFDYNQNN